MGFTNFSLDNFVSQDLSKLTACNLQPLSDEFPDSDFWFSQFVLRRMFQQHVRDEKVTLVFAVLRRTHAALDEWHISCETSKGKLRDPGVYFTLLRHVENCLASLWQGLEFARKALGTPFFQKGDGTVYERLNWVYNVSRHFDPESLPSGDLHRVWLTNGGVSTREHSVTFDEIQEMIKMLAQVADKIAGPA